MVMLRRTRPACGREGRPAPRASPPRRPGDAAPRRRLADRAAWSCAAFRQHLEAQRAGERRGLDEPHVARCRRGGASRRCGRRPGRAAPRRSGSSRRRGCAAGTKPSAPVSSSCTNRPERVTPVMRPVELRADPVGQVVGDQPVDRLALGRHGAALGGRDLRRDLRQLRDRSSSGRPSVARASARGSGRGAR